MIATDSPNAFLTVTVDRLGLLLWVAWLSRRDGNDEGKPEDNGSGEFWRAHR